MGRCNKIDTGVRVHHAPVVSMGLPVLDRRIGIQLGLKKTCALARQRTESAGATNYIEVRESAAAHGTAYGPSTRAHVVATHCQTFFLALCEIRTKAEARKANEGKVRERQLGPPPMKLEGLSPV